ncbi:MAG TPA: permease, partial [Chthoniobacteraceae bacterium]
MSWFNFQFQDFAFSFLSVLFEGLPFLLLGSLIAGLVDVFVPAERMARWLPKNTGASIFAGGLLGLVLPMCECGSVVVIRRFIKKGLPVSCAVAYMLGAPIVSPIVALSTFAAFKGQNPWLMTSLRLGIGFLIAVAVGFIVRQIRVEKLLQPKILNDLPDRRRSGLRVSTDESQRDFAELGANAGTFRKVLLSVQSA